MGHRKIETMVRHLLSRIRCFTDPAQTLILKLVFRKGLIRNIPGVGEVYICPECRKSGAVPLSFEAKWWERLVQEIRPGDIIVDVGAYVGVLTVIAAKKAGQKGRVLAFEPNPESAALFKKNIQLNGITGQVEFFNLAIGEKNEPLILADQGSKSQIVPSASSGCAKLFKVHSRSLDEALLDRKNDILKIDTEGCEESVIRGAKNLLRRRDGYPRFIYIECHPLKWDEFGVKSKDIIAILEGAGYAVEIPETPKHVGLDSLRGAWVLFAARKN